jgi:hypothetical protein
MKLSLKLVSTMTHACPESNQACGVCFVVLCHAQTSFKINRSPVFLWWVLPLAFIRCLDLIVTVLIFSGG